MTEDEMRERFVRALSMIAPEEDPASIDPDANYREEMEIDSMDFLNLVTRIYEDVGVEIPDEDYEKVQTINDAAAYLAEKHTA